MNSNEQTENTITKDGAKQTYWLDTLIAAMLCFFLATNFYYAYTDKNNFTPEDVFDDFTKYTFSSGSLAKEIMTNRYKTKYNLYTKEEPVIDDSNCKHLEPTEK